MMVISKYLTFDIRDQKGAKSQKLPTPRDECQKLKLSTNSLFQIRNFVMVSISKTKDMFRILSNIFKGAFERK